MTWEIMNTDEFLRKNTSNEQMKMENQVTETTEKYEKSWRVGCVEVV